MNVSKEEFVREIMQRQRLQALRRELAQMEEGAGDVCAAYGNEGYRKRLRRHEMKYPGRKF